MIRAATLFIFALSLQGCRDLSIPPAEPNARDELAACGGSTVVDYTMNKPGAGSFKDVATLTCRIDEKVDYASMLSATASTVCAHAMNAYAPPLPRKITAARTDGNGTTTCAQTQTQCSYAFFIKQGKLTSDLELLGPNGCSATTDSARGVLFACCGVPAPINPTNPNPTGPGTTPVPGG